MSFPKCNTILNVYIYYKSKSAEVQILIFFTCKYALKHLKQKFRCTLTCMFTVIQEKLWQGLAGPMRGRHSGSWASHLFGTGFTPDAFPDATLPNFQWA